MQLLLPAWAVCKHSLAQMAQQWKAHTVYVMPIPHWYQTFVLQLLSQMVWIRYVVFVLSVRKWSQFTNNVQIFVNPIHSTAGCPAAVDGSTSNLTDDIEVTYLDVNAQTAGLVITLEQPRIIGRSIESIRLGMCSFTTDHSSMVSILLVKHTFGFVCCMMAYYTFVCMCVSAFVCLFVCLWRRNKRKYSLG